MKKHIKIITGISFLAFISCGKQKEETSPIRKDVTETVFATGVLEAEGTFQLTALSDGYLKQVNFKEGDRVTNGKVMAIIDNKQSGVNSQSATDLYEIAKQNTLSNAPLIQQAKNNVNLTKQKLEQDELQLKRYKKLLESSSISQVEFENIELNYQTSRTNYNSAIESLRKINQEAKQQEISNRATKNVNAELQSYNQIKSFVAGKVYNKFKEQGDFVKKGDVIATIGNASVIYAKVNIDESNIAKIQLNQKAVIQLNTNKDITYSGIVNEIYPSFNEATQSFLVKITFEKPLDFKIVNTQLEANITIGSTKNALLIPRRFLEYGGFVQEKEKKEKTKVTTKFISNEWVQVLTGINENAVLITEKLDNKVSEAGAAMIH